MLVYVLLLAFWGFPSGSAVKNLPAMQETQKTRFRSLGGEEPLEEGMATYSRILASFVKDKVSICVWIYPWAFYFIPFIYISVFVPVPYFKVQDSTDV